MSRVRTIAGRCPMEEIGDAQLYETPVEAVLALCRVDPWLRAAPRRLYDPACGPGAIVEGLQACGHTVRAGDKYQYSGRWRGKPRQRVMWHTDFYSVTPRTCPGHEAIVMNPPYSGGESDAFLKHAYALSDRVYCFLELGWLQGGPAAPVRDALLDSPNWIGFYPFRERLDMHRDNYQGRRVRNSRKHAWFVFGREGRADGPYTRRISIQEGSHG